MAATVTLSESNGAGETVTADITNTNFGSADTVNLNAASNPIEPNTRSFAKYQRLRVSALDGSTSIDRIRVWRTGALSGSDTHVTNARETTYGGAETYATPVATAITGVDQTMPTTEPSGANLGIGGSLTGQITTASPTFSDYLIHQLVVDSATTAGAGSLTLNCKYREIA